MKIFQKKLVSKLDSNFRIKFSIDSIKIYQCNDFLTLDLTRKDAVTKLGFSPGCGSTLEGSGNFRRCSLDGGSISLGAGRCGVFSVSLSLLSVHTMVKKP
jgi:hypothetical protein